MEFPGTLARLRRNTGVSAANLARQVDLELAVIERLERGDGRPPERQLVLDIAHALNLNELQTDELLWSANHLPRRTPASEPQMAHSVALFVDHENVYIALSELLRSLPADLQLTERRKIEPANLALTLRNAAEQLGWVKVTLAIADWERLPKGQVGEYLKHRYKIDYNLPGRNSADLMLADAIRDVLEDNENDDVDTYVLVTGDGGYLTVMDTLLRHQKQVQIWGVHGASNAVLQQNASEFVWVDDLLHLATSHAPSEDARAHPRLPVGEDPVRVANGMAVGNEVGRLEALAIHLSRYLRQRSWTFITFVRFLTFLAETGVFGATREEQLAWLSHAKETGVLGEEIVDDPTDSSRIARRFFLNETHPLVERAQAIRSRIGDIVPAGGRGLAFGVVVERLIADPDLQLSAVQAKNWLTWFVEAGYVQTEQVAHFRKEGVTVTLLRQNPGFWLPVAVVIEGDSSLDHVDGLAELAVVRLANFLERHPHFAWMAMSQLLNQMTDGVVSNGSVPGTNRHRAKQAIALAQDFGYLAVEQIPNLKTGGTTTVARLNRDVPRVVELMSLRDTVVHLLAELLVSRSTIPRAIFQGAVAERLSVPFEVAGAWVELLVSEGIFILDLDHDGSGGVLRTDQQDLIVSRVLFGAMQPVPDPQRI